MFRRVETRPESPNKNDFRSCPDKSRHVENGPRRVETVQTKLTIMSRQVRRVRSRRVQTSRDGPNKHDYLLCPNRSRQRCVYLPQSVESVCIRISWLASSLSLPKKLNSLRTSSVSASSTSSPIPLLRIIDCFNKVQWKSHNLSFYSSSSSSSPCFQNANVKCNVI